MSFVRGMEYGDQTLPINDLFVYFPVQLVPALVTAMEQQRFTPVGVKGGCGYRPRKQGEEDTIPSWWWELTARKLYMTATPECRTRPGRREHIPVVPLTHLWGKLCLFPSLLQLKLRIEVPLWRNVAEAKQSPADPQSEGVGHRLSCCRKQKQKKRLRTKKQSRNPPMPLRKGLDVFVIRYTRLATALGKL